jgi:hypothetical protein
VQLRKKKILTEWQKQTRHLLIFDDKEGKISD